MVKGSSPLDSFAHMIHGLACYRSVCGQFLDTANSLHDQSSLKEPRPCNHRGKQRSLLRASSHHLPVLVGMPHRIPPSLRLSVVDTFPGSSSHSESSESLADTCLLSIPSSGSLGFDLHRARRIKQNQTNFTAVEADKGWRLTQIGSTCWTVIAGKA